MLVAQISDTHILAPTSDHPAAQWRAESLRRCVADINLQRPDAVILTGDTVQFGQSDEYAQLCELLAPLQAPLYPIPGNRDEKKAMREALDDTLLPNDEFLCYTVENHHPRLVAIDSTSPGERKGVFCAARQAWLDAVLGAQPDRATLLFIHHPPFDIDDHYIGGYREQEDATALEAIVRQHPQVVGLLCGHVHCLVEREWAGTQARVMPSVALDVRKGVDEDEKRPIYLLHQLSDDIGLRAMKTHVRPCTSA